MKQSTSQQTQHSQYAQCYHPIPTKEYALVCLLCLALKQKLFAWVEIIRGPLNSVSLEIICLKLHSLIGVEPCFIVVWSSAVTICTTCCLPAQCIYILYGSDNRSRWPRRLRGVYAAALMLGLRVRIPKGAWMCVVQGWSLVQESGYFHVTSAVRSLL